MQVGGLVGDLHGSWLLYLWHACLQRCGINPLQCHGGSRPCTASAGTCPPDQTTFDYVRERTAEPFEPVYADDSASYVQEYRFDVSKLQPLVAAPHSPDNRKNAADCRDVKIDRVYIGCAARSGFACAPADAAFL